MIRDLFDTKKLLTAPYITAEQDILFEIKYQQTPSKNPLLGIMAINLELA